MNRSGYVMNGLLLVVSMALVLGLAELGLRLADPRLLTPGVDANPTLAEERNELDFYVRHRERAPAAFSSHDPHLGWDSSYGASRVRGGEPVAAKSGRRLVAVGDSFVFGNEVEADENFVALLDAADNGIEALNLGVPGYGIDQSYLKYQSHGAALGPDIVLFGVYVPDYERAVLAFTAAAKPRFQPEGERLVLGNVPVPAPADEFARISAELESTWRVPRFVRNRIAALRTDPDAFFDMGDRIAVYVLRALKNGLGPDQQLLVIHIPRGESFTEPDPYRALMDRHLRAVYHAEGVPVLDVAEVFSADTDAAEVARRFYVVSDRRSIGHFNPTGHRKLAGAIEDRLIHPGQP